MRQSSSGYRAWMLRCWEVPHAGGTRAADWRFSLEEPHSGERHGFVSFVALMDFLQAELASPRCEPKSDPERFRGERS